MKQKLSDMKYDLSGTKTLIIDLIKPQQFILPHSKPTDYANVATGSLEYRRYIDSSPNTSIKSNQIF